MKTLYGMTEYELRKHIVIRLRRISGKRQTDPKFYNASRKGIMALKKEIDIYFN